MTIDTDNECNWPIDDKEWLKTRRNSWNTIKTRLECMSFITKSEIKYIKKHYLGEAITKKTNSNTPMDYYQLKDLDLPRLLMELWLSPDRSEMCIEYIKKKYTSALDVSEARRCFFEASSLPWLCIGSHDSMFLGDEEWIYKQLFSGRCRPEDYPDLDAIGFNKKSLEIIRDIITSSLTYFSHFPVMPNYLTTYRVKELQDAILYQENDVFNNSSAEAFVKCIDKIIHKSHCYPLEFVDYAEKINEVLLSDSLPIKIKNELNDIRHTKDTFAQEVMPGSFAAICYKINNQTHAEEIKNILESENRSAVKKSVKNIDLYYALCNLPKPEEVKITKTYMTIKLRFGPLGDIEFNDLCMAMSLLGNDYIYIVTENSDECYQAKINFVEEVSKWGDNNTFYYSNISPIYKVGQTAKSDEYIKSSYGHLLDGISYIVEKYALK